MTTIEPRAWPRPRVFKIAGRWVWRCRGHGEAPGDLGGVGDELHPSAWGDRAWATAFALAFRHGALLHERPGDEVVAVIDV
jgi:hypothetical protein